MTTKKKDELVRATDAGEGTVLFDDQDDPVGEVVDADITIGEAPKGEPEEKAAGHERPDRCPDCRSSDPDVVGVPSEVDMDTSPPVAYCLNPFHTWPTR